MQWNAFRRDPQIDAELLDGSALLRKPWLRLPNVSLGKDGGTFIYHCGAPQTANLLLGTLPHARGVRRVGYWAWELPDPPAEWAPYGRLVHEIWVPSSFARDSLRKLFPRHPIRVVRHIPAASRAGTVRASPLFTVLAMADGRSSLARKNPFGAIEAFRLAFAHQPGAARMILKVTNLNPGDRVTLGKALATLPHSHLIETSLDANEMDSLYRSADVLLSLHRAEGFGLPMAEAMARGLPVVATAWSGNMDFLTPENSILVPYELTVVQDPAGIYSGSLWAEPDLNSAAQALRQLAIDPARLKSLSQAAHAAAIDWSTAPLFDDDGPIIGR